LHKARTLNRVLWPTEEKAGICTRSHAGRDLQRLLRSTGNRKAVLAERYNNQIEGLRMQEQTSLFNKLVEHVATIQFNESVGLWQIVVVQHEAIEKSPLEAKRISWLTFSAKLASPSLGSPNPAVANC
jgi:hypothetical protein